MSQFKRGLGDVACKEIAAFLGSSVGEEIKNNSNCLICIRNNYLNVYYNGCSLLKYKPRSQKRNEGKYLIHRAYLPTAKSPDKTYVALEFRDSDLKSGNSFSFIENILRKPSDKLQQYTEKKGEKRAIAHHLDLHKPLMIDLEIAFEREREKDESRNQKRDKIADRIDMAVINDRCELELVEVKLTSDSRLRSMPNSKPEILNQMKYYEKFILDETDNIKNSYKTVINNYFDLDLIQRLTYGKPDYEERLDEFRKNPKISSKPALLILGEGGMKGRYEDHYEKLRDRFEHLGYGISRYPASG